MSLICGPEFQDPRLSTDARTTIGGICANASDANGIVDCTNGTSQVRASGLVLPQKVELLKYRAMSGLRLHEAVDLCIEAYVSQGSPVQGGKFLSIITVGFHPAYVFSHLRHADRLDALAA